MNQEKVESLVKLVSVDHRLAYSVNPPFDELWIVPKNAKIQRWLRHMRLFKGPSNPLIRVRYSKSQLSGARPLLRQSETGKFYDMIEHLERVNLLGNYPNLVMKS